VLQGKIKGTAPSGLTSAHLHHPPINQSYIKHCSNVTWTGLTEVCIASATWHQQTRHNRATSINNGYNDKVSE